MIRWIFLLLYGSLAVLYLILRLCRPLFFWVRKKGRRLQVLLNTGLSGARRFCSIPPRDMIGRILSSIIILVQRQRPRALRGLFFLFLGCLRFRLSLMALRPGAAKGARKPSILFFAEGTAKKGQAPASRFRVYQYLPYLQRAGISFKVCPSKPGKYFHVTARFSRLTKKHGRLAQFLYLLGSYWMAYNRFLEAFFGGFRYDACFLQRELIPTPNLFVEMFVLSCFHKVVFDFDDSIFLRPSWANPEGGALADKGMERKIHYLVSRASQIIVSNEFLKSKVETINPRVAILPTPVDTRYYLPVDRTRRADRPVIIGWVGTSGNLFYLKGVMGAFERLWEERKDFRLRVVCNIPDQDFGIPMNREFIEFREWKLAQEIKNFDEMDIGIMPLQEDDWGRGKAGFKILQYMASGIPVVASPVGVNSTIVKTGENGLLALTEEEWICALNQLIDNPALRSQIGAAGRAHVEKHYSLEAMAPEFIRILGSQINGRW